MSHQELLTTLNSKQFMDSRTPETPYFALRAVVELHKPFTPISVERVLCMDCSLGTQYEVDYPCPTIQAIEKELE